MTPEKLAELEKLEAAATPGTMKGFLIYAACVGAKGKDNAELFAALRNNARDLFTALREAWRERDEARSVIWNREARELVDQAVKERDEALALVRWFIDHIHIPESRNDSDWWAKMQEMKALIGEDGVLAINEKMVTVEFGP